MIAVRNDLSVDLKRDIHQAVPLMKTYCGTTKLINAEDLGHG